MDSEYTKVKVNDDDADDMEEVSWTIFLRQLLIASSTWSIFFMCGMMLGAPTVILPQLKKGGADVTDSMASWISAGSSYGAIPWNLIGTILMSVIGRKTTTALYSVACVLISIFFYFSETPTQILIAAILQGLPYSATMTVSIPVLAEYASPKYRGVFLTTKTASLYWGIWTSNAIGTFFPWKYITMLSFVCSLYSLTVFYWPESPFFLAKQRRFDDCKKAHRWLKGTGRQAEKELETLIDSNKFESKEFKLLECVRENFKTVTTKEFYRPNGVIFLCISMYFFSGKIVYTIYAIEIIKRITDNESAAYVGMLILDGATVFSMYLGSYLCKMIKRRTLLFTSAAVAILFLFTISVYLNLVYINVFNENKFVSITVLVGFSLSVSCGPVVMATSLYGELTPVSHKSLTVLLYSIVFAVMQSSLLKISPLMFRTLKMHGTFLFFAISMSICMCLLYKYLPETKDLTLQEIEDSFKDKTEMKRLVYEKDKSNNLD